MAKKQRSKRRRKSASRLPWIIGAAGIAVLIALPIVINSVRAANLPGERFASQGHRHISLGANIPPYNTDPPTSGPHTPELAAWGTYLPGEAPDDQRLIHNMEDGGVLLWYVPGETEAETEERLSVLEQAATGFRRIAIVPREGMEAPYVLTAWRRMQTFEEPDNEAMRTFINAFEGIDNHPY